MRLNNETLLDTLREVHEQAYELGATKDVGLPVGAWERVQAVIAQQQHHEQVENVRRQATALYTAFMEANGLDLGSADEHLFDERLTAEQRQWLTEYCRLWDATERL